MRVSNKLVISAVLFAAFYGTFAQAARIPGEAYLAFSTFTFNGRGNEGGRAGEEIGVGFLVGNVGEGATTQSTVMLDSVDGPATMLSRSVQLPALAVGESVEVSGMGTEGIRFRVNPNAQITDTITLHMKWRTQEGAEGIMTRSLRVLRGQIVVTLDFGNAAEPEEGGIAIGMSGSVYATVENTGTEEIESAELMPIAQGCAQTVTGRIEVSRLQPGDRVRITEPLRVGVGSNCRNGDIASLRFEGNYRTDTGSIPLASTVTFNAGVLSIMSFVNTPNPRPAVTDNMETDLDLNVMQACLIRNLFIDIRVTHTFIGDLEVYIVHPNGTQLKLHDNTGGGTDNLYKKYGYGGEATPGLDQFARTSSRGNWRLRVLDQAGGDVGTIDRFEVGVRGYCEGGR